MNDPAPVALAGETRTRTDKLPRAVVRALSRSFGSALRIIYLAPPTAVTDGQAVETETRLLEACRSESVQCASTGAKSREARALGRFTHGGLTSTPGNGHLNPTGHLIAGQLMWEEFAVKGTR
jgi:hypothetical protein